MKQTNETKHGIPALVSFFLPGVGQFIKGHIAKGIFFIVITIFAYLSLFILIGFLFVPVMHIISAMDAYNSDNDRIF